MRFTPTEEQAQLADIARRFVGELPSVRAHPDGWDPAVWARIVNEQGWPGLAIPEVHGGFGFGASELSIALQAVGGCLVPTPLLATSLFTGVVLEAGSDAQKAELLPALARGATGAVVLADEPWVLDGATADWYAFVDGADGRILAATDVERRPAPSLDPSLPLGSVVGGAPGTPLAGPVDRALARGQAAIAAMAVGGAAAVLAQAVEYARVRTQFGRPIGSFQAIKHKCADMLVRLESARSAAAWAAAAIDDDAPDRGLACRSAKAYCTDAFFRCAAENIQIHGGVGFTWEHDAHLYLKRATVLREVLGSPRHHRAAVAVEIL